MKIKYSWLILFTLLVASTSMAKSQSAPQKVKENFKVKYPGASDISWEKVSEKEWTAMFMLKEKEMSATYFSDGKWIESETIISMKEVPVAVKEAFQKEFGNPDDLLIVKVENGKEGLFYEFGFGRQDIMYKEDGKRVK